MKKRLRFIAVVLLSAPFLFGCSSVDGSAETDEQLLATVDNAIKEDGGNLQTPSLEAISTLLKRGNQKVEQAKTLDAVVETGANCLDRHASWIDRSRGRQIYDVLKKTEGNLVSDSLVRRVRESKNRLQVLFLAVKLGIRGSQERLNQVLMKHGDKPMAEDFLISGSKELYEGGKRWANTHGYRINTGMGSHRVAWGRF